MLHDGIHEGIISETDWELAHQKREKTGVKYEKTHSLEHEHILSGILRCPLCGSGMYGNVNRKKKKDGTLYKDYFYYACKHRRLVDGHKCGYRKQWSEEKINNAVEEVIRKLVKNPKFEEAILNKIGSRIDTEEIEKEIEGLEKQHRQLTGAKARLGQQMDAVLERIRDIRASEKVFYRQALEIYTTSIDYDPKAEISIAFFIKCRLRQKY